MLKVKSISLEAANKVVCRHHRHSKPVQGHKFSIGVFPVRPDGILLADQPCGVAIVGRPIAGFKDRRMLEVTRACVSPDAPRKTNSMLFREAWRMARKRGCLTMITYTLERESGASLRCAGWVRDSGVPANSSRWHTRPGREWQNVYAEAKIRWRAPLPRDKDRRE